MEQIASHLDDTQSIPQSNNSNLPSSPHLPNSNTLIDPIIETNTTEIPLNLHLSIQETSTNELKLTQLINVNEQQLDNKTTSKEKLSIFNQNENNNCQNKISINENTPFMPSPKCIQPDIKNPTYTKILSVEDFTLESQQFLTEYHCPLCDGIYNNAVVDTCGHVFCKECFETFISFQQFKDQNIQLICPLTFQTLSSYPVMFPFVSNVLNKLQIYCKNKVNGCDWIGLLNELNDHLNIHCPKQIIPCELKGCNINCFRESFSSHTKQCLHRIVKCQFCELNFPFIELSSHHENDCTKIEIECPQQCSQKEKRELMEQHLKLYCDNTVIKCPFDKIGCYNEMSRKEMATYLVNNSIRHMTLIIDHVEMNEQNIKNDSQLIENILLENCSFKKQIEDFQKQIYEMQKTINTFNDEFYSIQKVFLNKKRKKEVSHKQLEHIRKYKSIATKQFKHPNISFLNIKHTPQSKRKHPIFDMVIFPKTISINNNRAKLLSNDRSQQLFLFSHIDINCYDDLYNLNNYYKWTITLITSSSWLGIGICDKTQVVMNGLKFNPIKKGNYNSGTFLLSTNGYIWNANNHNQSNIQITDSLSNGNVITFKFFPCKQQLQIQIENKEKEYCIFETLNNVFPHKGKTLTPCVIFLHPLDEIEMSEISFEN